MLVLIATDGSEAAREAGQAAAELLRPAAHHLYVSVIPEPETPMDTAGGLVGPTMTNEEAVDQAREERLAGNTALDVTIDAVGENTAERVLLTGSEPGRALCDLAEERQADVIVMGAEHRSLFQRLLVGSASAYVVRHAPCPVLVVPHIQGADRGDDDDGA